MTSETSYAVFSTPRNKNLINELRRRNKKLFSIPATETEKTPLTCKEENLLLQALNFDWIIFTDVFTVDYFVEFLFEKEFDLYDLDAVRICALGEAVSDRLRFSEIHADIIAPAANAGKIYKLLGDYISEENFPHLKFLIIRESTADVSLAAKIKDSGADAAEISIYRIPDMENSAKTKLKALFAGGAIDEIIFSSPEDFTGFKKHFSAAEFETALSETVCAAADDVILQMLSEHGLQPVLFDLK